jgi:ATP-binding cassette subfamily B protein
MSRRRGQQPAPMRTGTMVRAFLPYLRPQWPGYTLALVLAVAGTAAGLLKPWPLKYLFDSVLVPAGGGTPEDVGRILLLIVLALAGITVLDSLIGLLRGYVLNVVGERVSASVRSDLYAHLQRLPLTFHETTPTGELTNRLTSDVDKVRTVLTGTVVETITNTLTLVGMASVLLFLDWQLSLGLVLVMPLLILVVMSFRRRIKAVEEDARAVEGELAAAAQESLSVVKLIKSMGREDSDSERFAGRSSDSMRAVLRTARTTAGFSYALDTLVALATAGLVWLGAQRVLSGALTPGDLLIFTAYLRDFFGPTRALSKLPAQLARAGVRAARIVDILDREPLITDRPGAVPAEAPKAGMRLQGVSFRYVADQPVLRNVDLVIPVGTTVAVVGPTGAGKSTIAALLCRLQDPVEGAVLLDGRDLRDLTLDSLHEQVALVLQEAMLLRASVRENIAYGRPEASPQEVLQAATVAQANAFIEALPDGYDTVLAERGASLSGGQKQRISLARAVLQDPSILVLDEPTTGLDARSEHAVLDALREVSRGRTTVLITHRMAAAMTADEIVVLDHGVVVETGQHGSLLAAGGLYAEMCRLQKVGATRSGRAGAGSNGTARGDRHVRPRVPDAGPRPDQPEAMT